MGAMNTSHPSDDALPRLIHLHAGQVIALPDTAAGGLRVLQGRVWLTRHNDLDDHFLEAGQGLDLRPDDQVVIEAERGPARCLLLSPADTTPVREALASGA